MIIVSSIKFKRFSVAHIVSTFKRVHGFVLFFFAEVFNKKESLSEKRID